jgi:putative ABC transport system permease protein
MARIPGVRRFFRLEPNRSRVDDDVDRELAFHFEMTMRELMSNGMSEDDARREARRRFGDVAITREKLAAIDRARVDQRRRQDWWEAIGQDLRYAIRGLRNKPGFTLGIVITLALGIGANAAMFGIVDRLLIRPPAYLLDPSRTHKLYFASMFRGEEYKGNNQSYKRFTEVAEGSHTFDRVAAFWNWKVAVGVGNDAIERTVGSVSASFFTFFSARPVIGRWFTPDEDHPPAGAAVAVLGYRYWQDHYNGATDVLGKKLNIGRQAYTIIGVAPDEFNGTSLTAPAAFVPITAVVGDLFGGGPVTSDRWYTGHNMHWLEIIAHRKPGVSLEAATADLTTVFQRSYIAWGLKEKSQPPISEAKPRGIVASIIAERGPNQRAQSKVALWLVGVAAIVLLVACANVANLLLGRALRRRREIAVRIALGVGRARLLAQLFTESVLLALLGAIGGLLVAQWGGGLLRSSFGKDVDWTGTFADSRTILFAAVIAIGTGLLTGLAPALQSRNADLTTSLKAGAREGTFHRSRLRTALVILQGALSVVLLTGAGLFVRSLHNVNAVKLGFDADHIAYVNLSMRDVKLDSVRARTLRDQLAERASALPGVVSATRMSTVPFYFSWNDDLFVSGIDSVSKLGEFFIQTGSPNFFETVGTRILRGRGFTTDDRAGSPKIMVLSESMAKRLWPTADALGKCIRVGADTMPCTTVVGVAEDIRQGRLTGAPGYTYYMPQMQVAADGGGLFVRTRADARTQTETLRRELQRLMPGTAYLTVQPLRDILDPNYRPWQLGATMFTIFGLLALVLAAVGLYSVIAYAAAQRMHEMGVRVALGAQSRDVIRIVVGEGLRLALVGIVVGTVAALVTSRFVAKLLFDVPAKDPMTLTVVTVTLLSVAIAASLAPALRASRVDPSVALRSE